MDVQAGINLKKVRITTNTCLPQARPKHLTCVNSLNPRRAPPISSSVPLSCLTPGTLLHIIFDRTKWMAALGLHSPQDLPILQWKKHHLSS